MEIDMLPRKQYVNELMRLKENGRVKIITGLRRSGKSVLLFDLFRQQLLDEGVVPEQIIGIQLDDLRNMKYRDPLNLDEYIRSQITDAKKVFYVFIDEIQLVSEVKNPYVDNQEAKISFVDVVLGLLKIKNVDVYVTSSNSKMLSSDVLTQFRDRGDEIRVFPLSFAEFYDAYEGDKREAWQEYYTYGGMPMILEMDTHERKSKYLRDLFERTYIKDIMERNKIKNDEEVLAILLDILASGIGSLTNPGKLSNTFKSERNISLAPDTIDRYLHYFEDSYLLQKAKRYDVKGKKYIKTPSKYYYTDLGLRNARLGFRQIEEIHLMENVLYNDLIRRGFDVDVGVVEIATMEEGKKVRKQLEVDFVVNRGNDRYYIQSALSIADPEKKKQEIASLLRIPDSFKKMVVVKDYLKPWKDDNGIQYVGIEHFLRDENILVG
ncbi:MAG: ATP-binding protein [Lachnospiraceae bacterium]|nr:ATP-binding protein [Lachnospiraceae bacterium]